VDGRANPASRRFWADLDAKRRARSTPAARRRSRSVSFASFGLAVALPCVAWYDTIADIAAEFRWDFAYLVAEWTPWILLLAGLLFLLPVAWSAGRDPESRWYPRARNAYAGWGITLYLLGVLLGTQVAQISSGLTQV
jgi:hypothetical protein